MSSRPLPSRATLVSLDLEARALCRSHEEGKRAATSRAVAHAPSMKGLSPRAARARRLTLAEARLILAREHGFDDWARLTQHVKTARRVARCRSHPRFDEAVEAMDLGDVDRLRALIASEPALIRARTNLEPPFHPSLCPPFELDRSYICALTK